MIEIDRRRISLQARHDLYVRYLSVSRSQICSWKRVWMCNLMTVVRICNE